MALIGLFFGSDEGNTQAVADKIALRFGEAVVEVHDIADVTQAEFDRYDKIILGISTWDFGQIQSDWEEFWPDAEALDYSGKTVAFYGLGDQFGYGDFFVDAMGMLHDIVLAGGARVVGHWSTEGYEFDASKALCEGGTQFVGLALDEDQQPELTDGRLDRWCRQVHSDFELTTPLNV